MFTLRVLRNSVQNSRSYATRSPYDKIKSAFSIDYKRLVDRNKKDEEKRVVYPEHADIAIIGGGVIGSSIAFWLKERAGKGLNVVVLEKDPSYTCASTVLSVGGLRQQFSLPENILMSQYGAEFLRTVKKYLGQDVDIQFSPHGYLVLAREKYAEELEKNVTLQREFGVKNELLTASKLKSRFPWLNTQDLKLGCIGLENEGWFDPWALLNGFRKRSIELGAIFVKGEVTDFTFEHQRDVLMEGIEPGSYRKLDKIIYETDNEGTKEIKFAMCILAAGAQSGKIAQLAHIGTGDGLLNIPLPIEPRKRNVYCFECKGNNPPGVNTPMIMDITGTYMRREGLGNNYICGRAPSPDFDKACNDLDVDHEYFNTDIWPALAHRVPAFESIKVKSSWAGHYEYNTYDENGIIGPHPYYQNLYIASGFSGHGLQQSPATGRAIAELILDGRFDTIDLTRLGFDRLITDTPMIESNIY